MSELERIEELEKEIKKLKGLNTQGVPQYSFSTIKESELHNLVSLKRKIFSQTVFEKWLNFEYSISEETVVFLENLIERNRELLHSYDEEDLKIHFIAPLIAKIDYFMLEDEIRNFYHEPLLYETEKFILNGRADMMVSKGLFRSEKPYFFIQEFKKGIRPTDPEPQLLAELISAIELNKELSMKGAYIIGENWNFVILEKLGKDRYQYFVSRTFNCTNIEDLKGIYRNLMFVKKEIIEMIESE